jgi:nitrogenase molybdenum-iron protein beta chain
MEIRIISTLTAGSYLQQIKNVPQAALNVVTHDDYGTPIAQYLKEKFGIPLFGSDALPPYGMRETTSWLQSLAAQLDLPSSEAKGLNVEKIVRDETEAVERRLIPQLKRLTLRYRLKGVPFAIFAEVPACLSIASFLEEYLGLEPVLLGVKTVGQNTNKLLNKVLAQSNYTPKVLLKPDGFETQEALKTTEPQLLLGSSLEKFLAYDAGVSSAFVGISYPVADEIMLTERPFVGYRGVLTIAEKVINAVCFKK